MHIEEPAQSTVHIRHSMDFTSTRAGALRTSKDFWPQMIVDKEEDKDVQQLLTNRPIGFCAIGVAVFLFAVMGKVRMRGGIQPPSGLASSGRYGTDMSLPMAAFSGDKPHTFSASAAGLIAAPARVFFLAPSPRTALTPRPALDKSMLGRLDEMRATFDELTARLADPDVLEDQEAEMRNPKERLVAMEEKLVLLLIPKDSNDDTEMLEMP